MAAGLVAAFAAALLSPAAPRASSKHTVVVLVTQGMEDVAANYLTERGLADTDTEILSQPWVALGEAAVGRLLVHVPPCPKALARLQQAPVVQACLAFIAGCPPCYLTWSSNSNHCSITACD